MARNSTVNLWIKMLDCRCSVGNCALQFNFSAKNSAVSMYKLGSNNWHLGSELRTEVIYYDQLKILMPSL